MKTKYENYVGVHGRHLVMCLSSLSRSMAQSYIQISGILQSLYKCVYLYIKEKAHSSEYIF